MVHSRVSASVSIFGIPVYAGDEASLRSHFMALLRSDERSNACISATAAHTLVHAVRDSTFYHILRNFYLNLPDGRPIVFLGRHMKKKNL